MASKGKSKQVNAMEKEIESLHASKVLDLVELSQDREAVGSKWVNKTKRSANGTIERHKT